MLLSGVLEGNALVAADEVHVRVVHPAGLTDIPACRDFNRVLPPCISRDMLRGKAAMPAARSTEMLSSLRGLPRIAPRALR